MHHIAQERSFAKDVSMFLQREHAVCATPTRSPARYAREYRVGLVLEAPCVRLQGKTVAFGVHQVYSNTMGDSWLCPSRTVKTLDIQEYLEPMNDDMMHMEDRVSLALASGYPLWAIVEVWIIPTHSRLLAITVDRPVYERNKAAIDEAAAELGVPVHVRPAPRKRLLKRLPPKHVNKLKDVWPMDLSGTREAPPSTDACGW